MSPGSKAERLLFALVLVAMGWFYVWSARTEDASWHFGQRQTDYYNLLVDGMLDGHLSLKVDVPPQLLELKDPYNPANRPPGMGLHDASLYHGKYYLYFGAAPVIALLLPFRLFTNTALPLPLAVVIFAYAGFLVSAGTWGAVRRRYFPDASTGLSLLLLVALGTASMVPILVRRANIWELPLAGGYFFSAVAIFCVFRALHVQRRATAWLAGASLALGLAVASRPTYLYAAGLLLIPLLVQWRTLRATRPGPTGALVRWTVAALVPIALVGVIMALYNYARFGNPLEFGVAYQFSGIYEAKARHFSLSYAPYNLRVYGWAPFDWSLYFPFIHAAKLPPPPPGHFGTEAPCGLLNHVLIVWLALVAPLAALRRTGEERRRLLTWMAATASVAIGTLLTLGLFYAVIGRYENDYMPTFVLLATIGALAVERALQPGCRLIRRAVITVVGAVALASAGFGVLFSLVIYGNFQRSNPRAYAAVARLADYPAYWLARWHAGRVGAVDMTLRFPAAPAAAREPLVAAGWFGAGDHVFVEYGTGHSIRLGYAHDSGGRFLSRWIAVTPHRDYKLRVEMGSLYPPEEDPMYAGWPAGLAGRITRHLHVELDGQVVLDTYQRYLSSAPDRVSFGTDEEASQYGGRFSGVIVAAGRDARLRALADSTGRPYRLQFALAPQTPPGGRQPLLTVTTAAGPVVWFLDRAGAQYRFGYSDARAGAESEPVAFDAGRLHELDFDFRRSAVPGTPAKTWISLDGTPAWTVESPVALISPHATLGRNTMGAPDCAAAFGGSIAPLDFRAGPSLFDRITMAISLPRQRRVGAHEPIVVTGVTGGADFLYIDYLEGGRVRFGLEHWGKPAIFSPSIPWLDAGEHTLDIALGSFPGAGGHDRVVISLDGREVWNTPARFYRAEPADVFVGRNPVGGTGCVAEFGGTISDATRLAN